MLPTISLCMIVRNEAKSIDLALKSACPFVDEIIIVDTGSTDNTIEICHKYTDKIYHFKWCDDFSLARNESIKYATKDWVLVLDADEVLEQFSAQKLKAQLAKFNEQELFFTVLLYNMQYIKVQQILESPGSIDFSQENVHQFVRLFRSGQGITYKYSLHELPMFKEDDPTYRSELVVLHYGYHQQTKERLQRALACLAKDKERYPEDVYVEYNYARTLLLADRYTEAAARISGIIKLFIARKADSPLLRLDRVYREYIEMLMAMEQYEDVEKNSPGLDL